MAFFRSVGISDTPPAVEGRSVVLRWPDGEDYNAWARLREVSRNFLTPWEPAWPPDDLTRAAFRRRIRRYADDQRNDLSYTFFIFRKQDDALVGGITIANVRRGVAQTGSVGYWMGEPYARQGYMSDAVRTMAPFAFGALALHRLDAACIPTNAASARLLEKCGFRYEGVARQYLCINGQWHDHYLYARLRDDPPPPP